MSDHVLTEIYKFLKWILDKFPTVALPSEMVESLIFLRGMLHDISFIFPINTFFLALMWYVLVSNVQFFISAANWVIRKIPFIS